MNFAPNNFTLGRLPNVRTLFIPDNGKSIIDMDLDRADAQVVAWEANDLTLIKAMQQNADLHLINASEIFNLGLSFEDCLPSNPNLKDLAKKHKPYRDKAKAFCHAVNYGAKGRRIASVLGVPKIEGERLVKRYLEIRPKVKEWQDATLFKLNSTRTITNKFGYRRVFQGRVENLLPQALAWVPQSTVAIVIDACMDNIITNLRHRVDVLGQVHDSLFMQTDTNTLRETIALIKEETQIIIPYDLPLIIPCSFKHSSKNWGDA